MTNTNNERSGWKAKGRSGAFHVWHAAKNLYYVTEGECGSVVFKCDQFGIAFARAGHLERASKWVG